MLLTVFSQVLIRSVERERDGKTEQTKERPAKNEMKCNVHTIHAQRGRGMGDLMLYLFWPKGIPFDRYKTQVDIVVVVVVAVGTYRKASRPTKTVFEELFD